MGIGRVVVGGERSGTAVACVVVVRVSFNGVLVRVSLSADALGVVEMTKKRVICFPCLLYTSHHVMAILLSNI